MTTLLDMRLSMMADHLVGLPIDIFNKIMAILGGLNNSAAMLVQRTFRGGRVRRRVKKFLQLSPTYAELEHSYGGTPFMSQIYSRRYAAVQRSLQ